MDIKDLNILHRFVGAVEGVVISLPSEIQGMIYDYIEVVDGILDKEENLSEKLTSWKGGVQE